MLLISITLIYGVFALLGIYIIRADKSNRVSVPVSSSVSVIVALRNEEKNINRLIKGLIRQKYPFQIEYIFVDDNSSDKTLNLLNKWALKDKRIRVVSNVAEGKKSSIATGVKFASNAIVVQTDADCEIGQYWIMSSVNKLLSSRYDMVIGPVYPFQSKTILNGLIRLEWLALQFITILTARLKNAGMANGANLTFYKKDYEDFNLSKYGEEYASGDDMFFMRFLQKNNKKVVFNLDQEAIVKTEMPISFKGLIQQRIRWATKAGKTTNSLTYFFTFLVVLANFSWVVAALLVINDYSLFTVFSVCVVWKLITDLVICWNMARFYNDFKVLFLLPLIFLLYPIYLITGFVLSFTKSYHWKDRTLH
ncbi:MAG: hypothetical protein CMP63_07530 [Flavobacteriales bacterium]|nr:hypothetical protein [Flavobacteriales bacterium]|tara:strand:- start:5047 stop:6141 length:1095 start_codon:yes stop_codon:yes gene_type:complete